MNTFATIKKPAKDARHLSGVVLPLPVKVKPYQKHHQSDEEFNRLPIELKREQANYSHLVLPSDPRRFSERRGLVALSATALKKSRNALQSWQPSTLRKGCSYSNRGQE